MPKKIYQMKEVFSFSLKKKLAYLNGMFKDGLGFFKHRHWLVSLNTFSFMVIDCHCDMTLS